MYNKKVLREATKNLDKTVAPAKKKDMIIDPMGQWKYPGQNTRIPSNDITMQGVPYPVWAVPNVGTPQMMYPEQDYYFPGADHVDEYPQMQFGGPTYISTTNPKDQLGYDAAWDTITYNPNDEWQNINNPAWKAHEDFHHKQNIEGRSSTYGILGQRPNPYLASDEAMQSYYNRRQSDLDNEVNKMIQQNPSLQFIPREKLYDSLPGFTGATERMYKNPNTEEGEAREVEMQYEKLGGDISIPQLNQYEDGGEYDLTQEEIDDLIAQGYQVEDVDTDEYKKGGFQDDLGKHRKLIRDWTYGQSIGMLQKAQEGLDTGVVKSKTPWAGVSKAIGDPNAAPVIYEGKDVTVKAEAPKWARFQKEYQNANPWERYLAGEKNKYLRKNKGLNKAAGVTADNFPKDAEERIRQEYNRKMNTYTTRRLGKYFDYNPRQRGEWIDLLTPKEKEIVAGSKYGSKLQPDAWSRFMSGARSIYNAGPLSNITGDITTPIPGYTERENKEALNNWAEGMEALAPLDIPGMVVANKMKNMNTENPSWYSGEMMGNVDYGDVVAMNPLTLLDLYGLPQAGVSLGRGIAKGSKALGKVASNVELPKYKNVYRVEPTTFAKDASDDLSGRWFGSLEEMPFYVKNLKDPNAGIRIMRSKMPVKKWEKVSGLNMPEQAKVMSAGTGNYNTFQDAANAGEISAGAAKRLSKGVQLLSDLDELANNPRLINLTEGILPESQALKIRTARPNRLSSFSRVEYPAGNLGKQGAWDYISNVNQDVEKPIMGIPRQYIPFQDGGDVDYQDAELTPEEIDWYLANGYDLEELPDDYEMPMAQGGFEIQGLRTQPVKTSQPKPKAQVKEDVVVSKQSAPSKVVIENLRTTPVKQQPEEVFSKSKYAYQPLSGYLKNNPIVPEQKGLTPYAANIIRSRGQAPVTGKTVPGAKPLSAQEEADMYNILSENNMTFSDKLNRFMDPKTNLFDKEIAERNSIEQQQAKRLLEKKGIIKTEDYKLDPNKTKAAKVKVNPNAPKPAKFYQELGTVPDSYDPKNKLLSYRNQWDNSEGFEYIATPVGKDRTGKEEYKNVKGVGHFLLDASVAKDKEFKWKDNDSYLNKAKKNNEWIPAFTRLEGDRVKLKYKKPNELTKSDIVVTPLRQMKYDEIKFDQTQRPEGFASGVKEVKKSDGQGTYLLFKDRDGYSRFSGGSVVFIFKDKNGNTIVRDFAGSLNGIENEGIQIKKQYKLKPNELTIGYHDVGSFSAKPKADSTGTLRSSQWEGYNKQFDKSTNPTGGALLIPND